MEVPFSGVNELPDSFIHDQFWHIYPATRFMVMLFAISSDKYLESLMLFLVCVTAIIPESLLVMMAGRML